MLKRAVIAIACVAAVTVGCSAVEDEVATYLKSTAVKRIDSERGETRFRNLGSTTLKLICQRTAESEALCHTVPIVGAVTSCDAYQVVRKDRPDFSSILGGEINKVTALGPQPGAQCPQASGLNSLLN